MQTMLAANLVIQRPAGLVWDILVDIGKYGEWNSYSPEVQTDFTVGAPVRLLLDMGSDKMKRMTMTIQAYDPPRGFSWGMAFGAGWIFRGVREQWLEPLGENSCRYHCQEKLSGLLAPLILAVFGNHLRHSCFKAVRELRDYAETLSNSARPV